MTDTTAEHPAAGERPGGATSKDSVLSEATVSRRKKRVLIYGINYAPEPIGVGRYTGELGAYLSQQGVEVEVIAAIPHYPGWAPRDGYGNVYKVEYRAATRVTRCPLVLREKMSGIWRVLAPLSFAVSSAPVAIWRILTFRPDTVLCVEPTLFNAPIALFFSKLIGARTVLHVQDLEIDAAFAVGHLAGNWMQRISALFERTVLRSFDAVVTISNRMQERLEAKGVTNQRLSVARNWVDLEKIKPLNRPSMFRHELAVSEETFVVLYSGNIGLKQALNLVLEAATQLVAFPNFLFVIAGEGPEKPVLVDMYRHLPNVRFLPLQSEENLCELLNLADVHILPQHRGTADLVLPSKIGGMLASGKACIVMAEPGTEMHEFLAGAVIVVEPGNSEALANAILTANGTELDFRRKDRLNLAKRFQSSINLTLLRRVILSNS